MDYLYIWAIILVIAIVAEIATSEALVSIWFAIGALCAIVLDYFEFSITIQIIAFFAISILTLAAIRPLAARYFRGNLIATNADRLIHQRTRLIKAISEDEYGEVRLNGVVWNVKTDENINVKLGTKVEILAIDGSKLIVKVINEGE